MMTNKTIPLKDHILSPNFRGLRSRNYATTIKYFDAANTSVSKRIDYTINILLTSKENRYLLNIDKKHFWFNRHQPDLINERIAEDLAKTIHPVQVGTDEKGNYSGITNFNEITNGRWH
ncbi:hypothetical protein VUJ46_00995 [Chryseobacterium sp. MYb264]|uniref:hypothetical protein n=1 Tax=Chryseobacterium sp. MYb264 TaxID=2745153 RepID=UPI002E143902|nr:hypothetical protein VUJ46_00995 [Chryseobacterium sp. MYb264]